MEMEVHRDVYTDPDAGQLVLKHYGKSFSEPIMETLGPQYFGTSSVL